MFDYLALVLEIISDTEIKVYALDTKEETVIIQYDRETKTFINGLNVEDEEIEEFRE